MLFHLASSLATVVRQAGCQMILSVSVILNSIASVFLFLMLYLMIDGLILTLDHY